MRVRAAALMAIILLAPLPLGGAATEATEDNLIVNPGFETTDLQGTPTGWTFQATGRAVGRVMSDQAYEGSNAFAVADVALGGGFDLRSSSVPVAVGQEFVASIHVNEGIEVLGGPVPVVYEPQGTTRVEVEMLSPGLAVLYRLELPERDAPLGWSERTVSLVVPYGVTSIRLHAASTAAQEGAWRFDSASITRGSLSPTTLLSNGGMSSGTPGTVPDMYTAACPGASAVRMEETPTTAVARLTGNDCELRTHAVSAFRGRSIRASGSTFGAGERITSLRFLSASGAILQDIGISGGYRNGSWPLIHPSCAPIGAASAVFVVSSGNGTTNFTIDDLVLRDNGLCNLVSNGGFEFGIPQPTSPWNMTLCPEHRVVSPGRASSKGITVGGACTMRSGIALVAPGETLALSYWARGAGTVANVRIEWLDACFYGIDVIGSTPDLTIVGGESYQRDTLEATVPSGTACARLKASSEGTLDYDDFGLAVGTLPVT